MEYGQHIFRLVLQSHLMVKFSISAFAVIYDALGGFMTGLELRLEGDFVRHLIALHAHLTSLILCSHLGQPNQHMFTMTWVPSPSV